MVMNWKQLVKKCIEQRSVSILVAGLHRYSTKHAGTAPSKIKNEVIKLLRKTQPDELYPLVLQLCEHESPTAQEIGAICLTDFYKDYPHEVNRWLYRLADSDNWEVREWVASACGRILETYFEDYYPIMCEWAKDKSENVRRTVVIATMYAGRSRRAEFAVPFLDLLELLLPDRSQYVRDNLGPFAIGSALIKYYPHEVLNRLNKWVTNGDEQVRWNIAMIFATSEGSKFAKEAESVIEILQADERPYVKRAVSKAMKNIEKRVEN